MFAFTRQFASVLAPGSFSLCIMVSFQSARKELYQLCCTFAGSLTYHANPKKKDALLNDYFSHLIFDFKLNVLHYWKAQFLSFENQKEKVLNLEAFGRSKKKSKNSQELFSHYHERKKFKIISVSLWWAITFKPFEIQTWDWSRMKENSKIFKITLTEKCLKVCLK